MVKASILSVSDVAAELGVSARQVRNLIGSGRLPASKLGRDWMIQRYDLAKVRDRKPGRPKGSSTK